MNVVFWRLAPLWVASLWWGSLTTLGFFVVPMLFVHLPNPSMAGAMAAKLFTGQTVISTGCGVLLLLVHIRKWMVARMNVGKYAMFFIVTGVLLAVLVEFVVAPNIVARNNIAAWHTVGSTMYFLQWICCTCVWGRLAAALHFPQSKSPMHD